MKWPIRASIAVLSVLVACTPVDPPKETHVAKSPAPPPPDLPPTPVAVEQPPPPVASRNCKVEVLEDPSQMASSETWRSTVDRLAADAQVRLRKRPSSEAAARELLCRNRDCSDAGPWIVGLKPPGEEVEHLAVVMPHPDGTVEMLADAWYSNTTWECNHKNVLRAERIADTTSLVHVRVQSPGIVGEWHSCPPQGAEGCVDYCHEATFSTHDWFLDPETMSTLAIVTRMKLTGPEHGRADYDLIPDASNVGDDVALRVDGRSIELDGCGIRERIEL